MEEYRYLDISIEKNRRDLLEKIFNKEKIDNSEMLFYDLSLYSNSDSFKSGIRNEFYKSFIYDKIILTRYQSEILNILDRGNLFLSAPTSFGKTFIALEYIKRNIKTIHNIVFIVPTLALMNELVKKIYKIFGNNYNICINSNEIEEKNNFYIFVPERSDSNYIKKINGINIDLLVYDEIYKLACKKNKIKTDDRILYMNKVYIDLIKVARKIVLLGPYIENMHFEHSHIPINRMYCNYTPVYNKIEFIGEHEKWTSYISNNSQLVYFNSPESIYKNINELLLILPEDKIIMTKYKEEIEFLENNYSKDWYVISLLKRGIGIHHGKTPMFLRKFYENEFNSKNIKVLLCTNTLMEGINTPAESLIIVDDPDSIFKLNNLMGRVGRLNPKNPIIGKIYINNKMTKDRVLHIDQWENIVIRAEDVESYSDDENLYLNKVYKDEQKNNEYLAKINKLKKHGVSIDDIKSNNLKMDLLIELYEGVFDALEKCTEVQKCIEIVTSLIKNAPSYKFKYDKYEGLRQEYLNQEYLPYKYYINNLLHRQSIKSIVEDFNKKYNLNKNINNINTFINSLFELNNYIKFKFCRIVDYISFINVEIKSPVLKQFIQIINSYNNKGIANKILEDLGIEDNDASKIVTMLNLNDKISTSKMIDYLKKEQKRVISNVESPFSKNNIENM